MVIDDIEMAYGGFIGKITPKETVDPKYLFYNLRSEDYAKYIGRLTDGANINNLKMADLLNYSLRFPSLPEQKQIVETLDKAFEKIDKAIANAEQNLQNAKELFESYSESVFKNKGDNWKVKKLIDVCVVERGSSPRPIKKFITDDDNGVNWIKIGDTKNIEKYIYETKQKITKRALKNQGMLRKEILFYRIQCHLASHILLKRKGAFTMVGLS